jgi:hypothetical protein
MEYPVVPIAITSAPIDWPTILAALFAAFLGAMAALILNAIFEKLRERRKRLDAINTAIYGLLLTIGSLVNLKQQFLVRFNAEFNELIGNLGEASINTHPDKIDSSDKNIRLILNRIGKEDPMLGAAFIAWQEEDFPMMPNPSDFLFTLEESPDLVRLIHVANSQTTQITKRINERNIFWRDHIKFEPDADDLTSRKRWPYMFQMLSYRTVISEYTDLGSL